MLNNQNLWESGAHANRYWRDFFRYRIEDLDIWNSLSLNEVKT